MKETKPSLTEEQANALADVAREKAEVIHHAYQSHTRWLFWLWLCLVLVFSSVGLCTFSINPESVAGLPTFAITFWLILITGGYVFSETRKLHRRIDGLLNLIDRK